ncbi:heavy metal translocating P-type ATPase [Rubritepida flocculans]|uniref:heavy metal translocating P-type ATPase n=1 Tax=Rubritepida flocculans TaxID=182403 RepID=UPI0004252FF2|nr:heavy metal translocating P-type ATPase [Rubritepida flocculans]
MNPLADRRALLAAPLLGLLGGGLLWLAGREAGPAFAMGALPVLAVLLAEMARSLRGGEFGLDLIAALAMGFGLVMGESLAANVVALMYAGGQFLDDHARRRASAEMTALLARQPRSALREGPAGWEETPITALRPGDRLLIPKGGVLPVDGVLESEIALLDTAALTGEPLPLRAERGQALLSGMGNAGEAFVLAASTDAEASTYAGILRLVRAAQESRAPMARLADRWSLAFLALTLVLAGGAWAASGEATRALAVLVVATPCPLILAVPVALMAGLSRAAALGMLVKSAAALEAMARVRAVVLDKTGTLTRGQAELVGVAGDARALRDAAALDQASAHPIARALVAAARARGLSLPMPEAVRETPGEGLEGMVEGRRVVVGGPRFVLARAEGPVPEADLHADLRSLVAVEGRIVAALLFADPLRAEAPGLVARLRAAGVGRVVLASGDGAAATARVAAEVGADAQHARLDPAGKVAVVAAERAHGPVMMLGDGLNDAPALAAADVGVAVGARGAAAAEAADAVLLGEGIGRLAPVLAAARRARAIAVQSVAAGIGLSTLGMIAAALGHLTPVQGALLQEAIDVAVILNALRALKS